MSRKRRTEMTRSKGRLTDSSSLAESHVCSVAYRFAWYPSTLWVGKVNRQSIYGEGALQAMLALAFRATSQSTGGGRREDVGKF